MSRTDLAGRRVLITGAARGVGAELARRLHRRGARLALLGIEPELLAAVAEECEASAHHCDVAERAEVDGAVADAVEELGGLDVVVANAGVASQLPLLSGDPEVFERTIAVNLLGTYYLVRATGPHVSHKGGYALLTASLAAAIHIPLLAPYNTSKAAVEALGNTLRNELAPSGARVGVAYYAELDTEMTSRGFDTKAARRSPFGGHGPMPVTPVEVAIDALERGIERRSRRIVAPRRVTPILFSRMAIQSGLDRAMRRRLPAILEVARTESPPLTTPQSDDE